MNSLKSVFILMCFVGVSFGSKYTAEMIPTNVQYSYRIPEVGRVEIQIDAKLVIGARKRMHVNIDGVAVTLPDDILKNYQHIVTNSVKCWTDFESQKFYISLQAAEHMKEASVLYDIELTIEEGYFVNLMTIKSDMP